jgi:hypothetical protein
MRDVKRRRIHYSTSTFHKIEIEVKNARGTITRTGYWSATP